MGTNYSVRDFKPICIVKLLYKYVVKHKSAKLFMTYVVGKLEAALSYSALVQLLALQL